MDAVGDSVFTASFFNEVLAPEWVNRSAFSGAKGFSIDSRSLEAGEVFVALRTEKRDGHEFLSAARDRGAAAAIVSIPDTALSLPQIVVEDPLRALQRLGAAWRKRWGGRVIAVTGSCGKTSTKEMLGLLLGSGDTLVTPKNLNNHIGVPLSELLLRPQHKRAVLEAGINQGGEMELLASLLDPEVAVVTTIGPAHLEKLGSIEGIAREKSLLPRSAREKVYFGPACSHYEVFTKEKFSSPYWLLPQARADEGPETGEIWTYSLNADTGTKRGVHLRNGSDLHFPAPETTAGMIENTCLALMVALGEGISVELILDRLSQWKPSSQRGEILTIGERTIYADHYNANPASFADAANYFHRRFPEPPRTWVIGGMEELGSAGAAWHRKLAAGLPVQRGDQVFLIGGLSVEMFSTLEGKMEGESAPVYFETVEAAMERILSSPGVLFLKGSRKYRLEKILDSSG